MFRPSSKPLQFILHAIIPVVCSIILGLILCNGNIFDTFSSTTQFIYTPIIASVFYYLLAYDKPKYAWLGLIVMMVLNVILNHSTGVPLISRDFLYVAAIAIAVFLYFKYFRQGAHINYFYTAFILAGLYSVAYIVTTEIHFATLPYFSQMTGHIAIILIASTPALYGVTIGFAVGGGITIADKLFGVVVPSPTKSV
ncbi:MAG: hypothetical protein ACYDEQ_03820 [Desulfocucumaceae bacterium]